MYKKRRKNQFSTRFSPAGGKHPRKKSLPGGRILRLCGAKPLTGRVKSGYNPILQGFTLPWKPVVQASAALFPRRGVFPPAVFEGGAGRSWSGRVPRTGRQRVSGVLNGKGFRPFPKRKTSEKEGIENAQNLSAQEETEKQGPRLPQENVHRQRPQGAGPPSRQRPRCPHRLRARCGDGSFRRGAGCLKAPGRVVSPKKMLVRSLSAPPASFRPAAAAVLAGRPRTCLRPHCDVGFLFRACRRGGLPLPPDRLRGLPFRRA